MRDDADLFAFAGAVEINEDRLSLLIARLGPGGLLLIGDVYTVPCGNAFLPRPSACATHGGPAWHFWARRVPLLPVYLRQRFDGLVRNRIYRFLLNDGPLGEDGWTPDLERPGAWQSAYFAQDATEGPDMSFLDQFEH